MTQPVEFFKGLLGDSGVLDHNSIGVWSADVSFILSEPNSWTGNFHNHNLND